ncbi:hypothetical protein NDA18_003008 [Ustilago nuda]|nr:hypothetical protein NDA18_003008 [Ustilago nuda]
MFPRPRRPASFLHNPSAAAANLGDASEEESLVEDSLNHAGPFQPYRSLPQPSLFTQPRPPPEADGFAYAATPSGMPNLRSEIIPQGIFNQPPAQPPRIERHRYRPPSRPPQHQQQQRMFGSPPADVSGSVSGSFSFAPRTQLLPAFTAPQIARGTLFPPSPPQQLGASLDSAAIAIEQRIQAARFAAGEPSARVVSFSSHPQVTTPQNAPNVGNAYPEPPRMPAAVRGRGGRRDAADASTSHLGRRAGGNANAPFSHQQHQVVMPTRLFALPPDTASRFPPSPQAIAHPFTTPQHNPPLHSHEYHQAAAAASDPSTSISISADPTNTTSHSTSHSTESPEVVRLRKWDGTQTTVPSYILSRQAENVVEDTFEYDTVHRFHPRHILDRQKNRVAGEEGEGKEGEIQDVDALQAILEIQLGLRDMHGWYGYTYTNPKPPIQSTKAVQETEEEPNSSTGGRISRKRRRSNCPSSPPSSSPTTPSTTRAEEEEEEEEETSPIVVYDTFGRIRGTVVLPSYSRRGGPHFPLPSPKETFGIRHSAGSHLVLTAGSALSKKEARLVGQVEFVKVRYDELQTPKRSVGSKEAESESKERIGGTVRSETFYSELKAKRKALTKFQRTHRPALLKGLQNALLDSTSLTYPSHY